MARGKALAFVPALIGLLSDRPRQAPTIGIRPGAAATGIAAPLPRRRAKPSWKQRTAGGSGTAGLSGGATRSRPRIKTSTSAKRRSPKRSSASSLRSAALRRRERLDLKGSRSSGPRSGAAPQRGSARRSAENTSAGRSRQERADAVDQIDAGQVGEFAKGCCSEPAHAEREAEEQAGDHPDPARHQLLRVDQDRRERRGQDRDRSTTLRTPVQNRFA